MRSGASKPTSRKTCRQRSETAWDRAGGEPVRRRQAAGRAAEQDSMPVQAPARSALPRPRASIAIRQERGLPDYGRDIRSCLRPPEHSAAAATAKPGPASSCLSLIRLICRRFHRHQVPGQPRVERELYRLPWGSTQRSTRKRAEVARVLRSPERRKSICDCPLS